MLVDSASVPLGGPKDLQFVRLCQQSIIGPTWIHVVPMFIEFFAPVMRLAGNLNHCTSGMGIKL